MTTDRTIWINIHGTDAFEEYLKTCISKAKYDDNPVPLLMKVLETYRGYKENEKVIRRIEEKGVKVNGE